MAREAMEMAEAAQAEVGQLRAENVAMAGELNELQQQVRGRMVLNSVGSWDHKL